MTTGYAVMGDLDLDADVAEEEITDKFVANLFGPTPNVTNITQLSAPDRQMALLEFTVENADLGDIMVGSDELIEITDDKQYAEDFLSILEDYPREPLGSLLIRGMSPRPTVFPM